jgi:hypothetical protein
LRSLFNVAKKGLVGKGEKDQSYSSYDTPYVRKDPTLFPPPPKTRVYEPGTGPVPPPPKPSLPPRDDQDNEAASASLRGPFRVDTTGVDTAQYQPPPRRHDGQPSPVCPVGNVRPIPPPRLPPRRMDGIPQNVDGARTGTPEPPEESKGYLNQDVVNRLGHAGITVPGLGIGTKPVPSLPSRPAPPPVPERRFGGQQMQELQSRISKLGSTSSEAPPGTTLAEKKAALKTAQALKNDPSSVSISDVRTAAATAKNFQDRHGEQVASGLRTANQLNQKYGLVDRAKAMVPSDGSALAPRPPPPPPPRSRPTNESFSGGSQPPPVPYGSKPKP